LIEAGNSNRCIGELGLMMKLLDWYVMTEAKDVRINLSLFGTDSSRVNRKRANCGDIQD